MPHLLLALFLLPSTWAAPTWPSGAALLVDTRQLLYDAPATTEAELRAREGMVGVDPRWPAADGAVGYLLLLDGKQVAELPAGTTSWSGEARAGQTLAVMAVDAQGDAAPVLKAKVPAMPDPLLLGAAGAGSGGALKGSASTSDPGALDSLVGRQGVAVGRPATGQRPQMPTLTSTSVAVSKGQDASKIELRLKLVRKQLAFCMAKAGDVPQSGAMTATLPVQADGAVKGPKVEGEGLSTEVKNCMKQRLARVRIEGAGAGEVTWAISW